MAPPKGHPPYPGSGRRKGGKNRRTLAREAGWASALRRLEISAERTLMEIGRIAFVDRAALWRDGRLLPFEQWPEDARALLEGYEVSVKKTDEGGTEAIHKLHLAKKMPALEVLAKHFGLVREMTSQMPQTVRFEFVVDRPTFPRTIDVEKGLPSAEAVPTMTFESDG